MKSLFPAFVALLCTCETVEAQKAFNREDLIGAWKYEFAVTEFADGRQEAQFSQHPQGIFIILPNGHYAHIIMANDLPKVRSRKFKQTTIEEAEKIAEGVLAHYGTWEAHEEKGYFTVTIEKSSFPNFDGLTQIRTVTELTKDTLAYVNNLAVTESDTKAVARLKRLPP